MQVEKQYNEPPHSLIQPQTIYQYSDILVPSDILISI